MEHTYIVFHILFPTAWYYYIMHFIMHIVIMYSSFCSLYCQLTSNANRNSLILFLGCASSLFDPARFFSTSATYLMKPRPSRSNVAMLKNSVAFALMKASGSRGHTTHTKGISFKLFHHYQRRMKRRTFRYVISLVKPGS